MLNDFVGLFYPNNCACCNDVLSKYEKAICLDCFLELPRTNFHEDDKNPVSKLFWGKVKLESGISTFQFNKKGKIKQLIHELKYKGNTKVGEILGVELGKDLSKLKLASKIDLLVPVPLHSKRQRQRGYNQSNYIAQGVNKVLNTALDTKHFIRTVDTSSQTRKAKYDRWNNVNGIFSVLKEELFSDKHILLVDDVVTTGSTIESCANALLSISGTKVSVATLASGI